MNTYSPSATPVHPCDTAPTTVAGELSDDDLEHVVGGLARAWDGGDAAPLGPGAAPALDRAR